jgi:membrane associated rhomboid family serine protease
LNDLAALTAQTGALVILVVTVAVSLIGLRMPALIHKCVLRPYEVWRGRHLDTLYLHGFFHADFGHLLFNMFSFYFFAFPLERRFGTAAFVIGYLVALVASVVPSLLKHRDDADYATLGASGGVTAVIFAYIVLYPASSLYLFLLPIPIPAPLFAVGYLAYSIYAGQRRSDNVNHAAHITGALCGLVWVGLCAPDAYAALQARWF